MPKADSNHALLAVITVDSAFKKEKKLLFANANTLKNANAMQIYSKR